MAGSEALEVPLPAPVDEGGNGAAGGAGAVDPGTLAGLLAVPLVPAQGVLLGAYYGDRSIEETSAKLGRSLPIRLRYYGWDEDWAELSKQDLAMGRIPLVNWEPGEIEFGDIVSGAYDELIGARAASSAALAQPFFLDFAAEMNGDVGWSGDSPPFYISAYRHIHDVFVSAGASNVVWAWCPNVTDLEGGNSRTLTYYPGDDYVNWTCVDGYNWGTSTGRAWQSFHDVFAQIYPVLASKKKPILIAETSCSEVGGSKATWIDGIVPTLRDAFPLIKALAWFDIDKEQDWRIRSSASGHTAFIRMVSDPYCNP